LLTAQRRMSTSSAFAVLCCWRTHHAYAHMLCAYASCIPPQALNLVHSNTGEGGLKSHFKPHSAGHRSHRSSAFLSAHVPCSLLALTGKRGRKLGGGVSGILLVPFPRPPELRVASVHSASTHMCGYNAAQKRCAALNQVPRMVGLGRCEPRVRAK
jgi:hypothetical protein